MYLLVFEDHSGSVKIQQTCATYGDAIREGEKLKMERPFGTYSVLKKQDVAYGLH